MQNFILIFFVTGLLSACGNSRLDRMENFENKYKEKNCEEIKNEITFQQKLKEGLEERQKNGVTWGDVGATALTLGINVIENSVNKNARNSRIEEVENKIELLDLLQKNKECTK